MACILEELEKTLTKQLGNTKNSKEFKDGTTKAKERVAELSTLLNEVGAMKKVMQGQVNTETKASNYDKPLADKIANKLQKLYSHIEVAYLNGQTEMRSVLEELSGGLTMFQLSNKRKQEFEQKLRKARPELADTKIDEVLKNIEQFSETESNGDEKLMKKLEILALHWTLKGNVILPEDGSKVMQALKIADKNKLDPFSYSNPNEITESFAKVEEKTKPLNPDDYLGKGYSNKQELTKGVVVYDVDDNDAGREISRAMIDTHFGKEANPWCLLARKNNSIAETAEYWYNYYPGDKKIAFRNGKLIAFYGDNQWWDRMDSPSKDIAIESKLEKDEEGRTPIQIEYIPMYSREKWLNDSYAQKDGVVKFIRGNRNNGVYEEWASTSKNSNEELELKEIRKNGVLKYSKKITINHYDETQKVDISINAHISKDMEFENDVSEYYDNEVIGEYRHSTDFVGEDLEKRTFSEIRIQSKSNSTPYSISVNEINMYKVNELKYYVTDSVGYPYEITKEKFDALFNEIKIGKTIKEYNSIIKELDNDLIIPFQKQDDIIKGAAVLSKNKILVDITNRSTDTLAHEYAHFYIAAFRDTPIVQEAIKKWGSEEALVQAIGEQVVKQKGEAYGWWKKFSKWVKDIFSNLDKFSKKELVEILTDGFLTATDIKKATEGYYENYQSSAVNNLVNNVYMDKGIVTNIQEFIEYSESVFKDSKVEYIVTHSTGEPFDESIETAANVFIEEYKDEAADYINKLLSTNYDINDIFYSTREYDGTLSREIALQNKIEKELKENNIDVYYDVADHFKKLYSNKTSWVYKEEFSKDKVGTGIGGNYAGTGFYFYGITGQQFPGYEVVAKLNITDLSEYNDKKWKEKGKDGYIGEIGAIADKGQVEIVVTEPEQIHIFGSDKDIKMFKKWKLKQEDDIIVPTDAKKTTSVDGELVNNKGFNGYISIKDTGGKGSVEGDAKDIAMREVADGFVGEISNGRLNNSSTGTSYNALKDNVSGPTSAGSITYHGAAEPSTVMLARNGSFRGKPLNSETKEAIEYYFQEGASFVVGDMPGVDSQFINYLDEIGASYKIYHTGSSPRIVKEDIKYQKIVKKESTKQEADIIVPTETFEQNVNRKIECKE